MPSLCRHRSKRLASCCIEPDTKNMCIHSYIVTLHAGKILDDRVAARAVVQSHGLLKFGELAVVHCKGSTIWKIKCIPRHISAAKLELTRLLDESKASRRVLCATTFAQNMHGTEPLAPSMSHAYFKQLSSATNTLGSLKKRWCCPCPRRYMQPCLRSKGGCCMACNMSFKSSDRPPGILFTISLRATMMVNKYCSA